MTGDSNASRHPTVSSLTCRPRLEPELEKKERRRPTAFGFGRGSFATSTGYLAAPNVSSVLPIFPEGELDTF